MRLFPVKPTNKAECGITSALKLASHVSVACGATSQYGNSLYSLSTQDVSQRNGSAFEIAAEDLPETGFRGGASRPLGRPSRKDLYRSRDTLAPINDTLRAVEASQARRSPLLAMRNASNPNFSNPIYSILEAADLRSHWTTSQIRQLSVTHLEWYEAGNGRDSFLLFEVLPTFTRGKPTWVRLERRPRTSASKQTLQPKMPIGNSSMSDIAILSKGKYDLLGPKDDSFIVKETVRQMLPLSFVLDVLDAVPENALSNSQLYASIIMNAVHQFCAPTDISRKDAASTQSNNPYRILRHTANKKACDDLAQEIELQQGWELL
ncbi:hypothetical protein BDV93DRAFT_520189 [Ceratobasidium sp. AG-I]|nr:hypothetical protein BDV93DRAFT_520189 [Ceratobasidium sp. AG-I]